LFELSIEFPFDYPEGSPAIKFVNNNDDKDNGGSPISHPNVDEKTGEVSVLWRRAKSSIVQALKGVRELLKYPSLENSAVPVRNEQAKLLWKGDRV